MLNDKRIRVVVGHYGSGKTEFSVNYAIKLAALGKKVALSDLDIVNPYFRSREKTEELEKLGIMVLGSSLKGDAVDLPALDPKLVIPLQDKSYEAVIDVGGDPAGARTLRRYQEYFNEEQCDLFFVLNAYRPETGTVEKAIQYVRMIEVVAGFNVTGIVNNTHMLKSTSVEDVLSGQKLAEQVSEEICVPIKYIVALNNIATELPPGLKGEIFPITLKMREEWMM